MSNTPETDAASYQISKEAEGLIMTPIKFARQMELDRDRARAEAERWRDNWKKGRTMSMIATTQLPWENVKTQHLGGGV